MDNRRNLWFGVVILTTLVLGIAGWKIGTGFFQSPKSNFDGDRAFEDISTQMSFGPRMVGSDAHEEFREWLVTQLMDTGWDTSTQDIEYQDVPIHNIIAKKGSGSEWIVLGAHYDSRMWADQEENPEDQKLPVPGANDGASGVAVLTELARVIPADIDKEIWLVFFDAEDNGEIPGYDWIMGSTAFVENLDGKPDAVVVVDMIGDADLNIYQEKSSTNELTQQIWNTAADLGYSDQFIAQSKYSMIDDHTPFLQAGIPAVDIIDFDYPYWHTLQDTEDKVSGESLKAVGQTLLTWITSAN